MKKLFSFFLLIFLPSLAFTASEDLILSPNSVSFSTNIFLEGKPVRIYANVTSGSSKDLRGVVKFFTGNDQIKEDQPISVLAGKDDSVFVDWIPFPGEHNIKILLIPFEKEFDDPLNNTVQKNITVFADTDRDGIANKDDEDDDNDGVKDEADAFPLNKSESIDSDGDTIGNNKDGDDDNDGVKDELDALPMNANETEDTDKDGIGNNEDTDDDGDGLSDTEEFQQKTDSLKPDTDGDGVNDKTDAYPLNPAQAYDYDKDTIPDPLDPDADNDGIPKKEDINDSNLGPYIIITTEGQSPTKIAFPDETVEFETTQSIDPDGGTTSTLWETESGIETGSKIKTSFKTSGFHKVTVKMADDKLETREKVLTILVIPPYVGWISVLAIFLIFIVAIFLVFSYSKRRRHL